MSELEYYMANHAWRLPGRHIDWVQEAQVDREWTGYADGRFADGSRWDPTKGSPREYVWTDDANCAGIDPDSFMVASPGDPDSDGLVGIKLTELNRERLESAAQICVNCPVKQTCLDESTPVDRFWAVRGGELPVKLTGSRQAKNNPPTWDNKDYEPSWSCAEHGTLYKRSYQRKDKKGREFTQVYCQQCWR